LNFETWGERNGCKSKDVSELRKGLTRAIAFTKKLIALSSDIGFKGSNT
jgi:hypothetical protein